MKLSEWRRENGLTQQATARLIECTVRAVIKWESGERRPGPAYMPKVMAVTDGQVTANDFYPDGVSSSPEKVTRTGEHEVRHATA